MVRVRVRVRGRVGVGVGVRVRVSLGHLDAVAALVQPELGDGLDRAVLLVLEGVGLAEHLVRARVKVRGSVRVKGEGEGEDEGEDACEVRARSTVSVALQLTLISCPTLSVPLSTRPNASKDSQSGWWYILVTLTW